MTTATITKPKEEVTIRRFLVIKCRNWLEKNARKTTDFNLLLNSDELVIIARHGMKNTDLTVDEFIVACIDDDYNLKKVDGTANTYLFNLEILP